MRPLNAAPFLLLGLLGIGCGKGLTVDLSAVPNPAAPGQSVEWTVKVRNDTQCATTADTTDLPDPFPDGAGVFALFVGFDPELGPEDAGEFCREFMTSECTSEICLRSRFEQAFKGKALPAFAPYDATDGWHFPSDDPFAPLQMIGECAVRSNPGGTRAVIEAPVGSPAENEAYRTVIPSLKACLPANNTYKFSRTVLEGLFAEAIYNLSVRASAPTTTKSEG